MKTVATATLFLLAAVGVSPNIGDGLAPINPVSLARLILPGAAEIAAWYAAQQSE